MRAAPRIYWIERPDQIRLLVSPLRQTLIDTLAARGPCAASELAVELGMAADALYYHLHKLRAAGLVVVREQRRTSRRDELVYALPGRQMRLRYVPADPRNARLVTRVVGAMLRLAARDFAAGITAGQARVGGDRRNLWAAQVRAWLTAGELREVNALLERLRSIFDGGSHGARRRLVEVTWALTPLIEQPRRRVSPSRRDRRRPSRRPRRRRPRPASPS